MSIQTNTIQSRDIQNSIANRFDFTTPPTPQYYSRALSFGLDQKEALQFYELLKREPSVEELAVCGALWSEHCSYKSSKVHLKRFHTKEPWVLQGPGENAGVVQINEEWAIAFKMESHNHPSFIEPYQGAATGVGGILRDIFCMGALPIANLNCLRFGENDHNGILLRDSVRGIGDYGNSVGVPTVTGDVSFHAGYNKNILVNAFCAGLIHKDKIYKGVVQPNTALVYFGAPTGRDGVHGATMSSKEFQDSESLRPTIQVGDPFMEKILLEATLALIEKKLVIGLQDMGAAGLTSSSVEMAGRSGCGVQICLDDIPKRTTGLKAFEILLSESQERMLCAVTHENLSSVFDELQKYSLAYAVIGSVNQSGLFECFYQNQKVVSIPVDILIEHAPQYFHPLETREKYLELKKVIVNESSFRAENLSSDADSLSSRTDSLSSHTDSLSSHTDSLSSHTDSLSSRDLLAGSSAHSLHQDILNGMVINDLNKKHPNFLDEIFSHPQFGDRFPLYSHYCATVKGLTVAGSGALRTAAAGVVMLPKYAQTKNASTGLSVAGGCEERFCDLDPYNGSILSALKIGRKIIASGGTPLAMTDCLNFGSPKNPLVMRQISDAIDGINLVAKTFHIPIVSGNVSLNNQTEGKPIAPTPMIGIVGRVEDVMRVPLAHLPPGWTFDESSITLVHFAAHNAFEISRYSASNVAWILGKQNTDCPSADLEVEQALWKSVSACIQKFAPLLCFPVGHGGLIGSLVSLALKSDAALSFNNYILNLKASDAFAEGNMGFIFGFQKEQEAQNFISDFQDNANFLIRLVAVLQDPAINPVVKPHGDGQLRNDSGMKQGDISSQQDDRWNLETVRPLYKKSLRKHFDTLWK